MVITIDDIKSLAPHAVECIAIVFAFARWSTKVDMRLTAIERFIEHKQRRNVSPKRRHNRRKPIENAKLNGFHKTD